LHILYFTGCFDVGFGFMKIFAFSRELAGWFYSDLGLSDSVSQSLVLVGGLDGGLGSSERSSVNRIKASGCSFDMADIFVSRCIANLMSAWD